MPFDGIASMARTDQFYIDGSWVDPATPKFADVINPATEEVIARIAMGSATDVDRAAKAATAAFGSYSMTSRRERIDLLNSILGVLEKRLDDIAAALTSEMGAPSVLSRTSQAQSGYDHISTMVKVLEDFPFEEMRGSTLISREAIGVCGLITPWNWPINQITCKVAPALAAGCTMVLKPSELAPLNALILAEVLHDAGVPAGVFNLVNGDGPNVGATMSSHPLIDMISFTGSTRAGIEVARLAASSVKRVAQELGGNSPNIVFDDADLREAVEGGIANCFNNSGQSCNSPARMLVPFGKMREAAEIAKRSAEAMKVGDPLDETTNLGPVVSEAHFNKIQALIETGIREGATLVTGGTGRPEHLNRGYFIRPTVFADVTPEMTIANTEIFGPVMTMVGYETEEDAIRIANETEYGLAAYIQTSNAERARRVARRLRAGQVEINYAPFDYFAPFGGYKKSGNGREYGEFGLHDYLETKATMGL
jgi:aldehyde dehydrogenase (NAD+)